MRASAPAQLAVGRLNPYGFRRFPEDRREPWHGRCHGNLYAMDTGNPTKPASREACRRAAVILRPACFSPEQPRALWRGVGCRASPCQTCEPRGPSPSGGSFTANGHSREPPRALWRGVGCRGSPPARPASREACCRAAVKPRPTGMSPEQPRALWARCGARGTAPYPCRRELGSLPSRRTARK